MGGAETMTKGPASREVVRPIRAVETGIVDVCALTRLMSSMKRLTVPWWR